MKKIFLLILVVTIAVQAGYTQIRPTTRDPQQGTNPKQATAFQINPITVDGNLSDWPAGLEKRSANEYLAGFGYQQESFNSGTQDNWFQVAWNDQQNKLYVSGWAHDDVNATQLSKWVNPDTLAPSGAPWFYDRWELYFEWDNDDQGSSGDLTGGGVVQYVIGINDADRGITDSTGGQETDASGNIREGGTMFFMTSFWDANTYILGPDGQPPLAQAKVVFQPDNPSDPFGPYTRLFEASFSVLTFLTEGVEVDPQADVLDLGPNVNDGRGLGFDVTSMDRDGLVDASDPTDILHTSLDNEGAWIGWSDGSKNANPQLLGTILFSLSSPATRVDLWDLF